MTQVDYLRPRTLDEALALLADGRERYQVLAGGTDLVLRLRNREIRPQALVDITHIPALRGIEEQEGKISIKSATTLAEIAAAAVIREKVPALAQACRMVGSPQIQYQATIGGNIANASPAADTVPALILFDAVAVIQSQRGQRKRRLTDLLAGAGKTDLAADELITEILLAPVPGSVSAFAKLGRRNALAVARISAAAALVFDGEIITRARIALGAVAPNPFRALTIEELLTGRRYDDWLKGEVLAAAQTLVAIKLGARASASYKREAVAGVLRDVFAGIDALRGR